jgi:hypothetical protein
MARPTALAAGDAASRVGVYQVKIFRLLRDCLKQESGSGIRISTLPPEAQRMRPDRVELAARPRIAARKQSDLVTQFDELVDEPGDHSFRAAVKLGWNTLGQGSDLGDTHEWLPE